MSTNGILIVELDEATAWELKTRLDGLGYRVAGIAFSGPEAIQLIEQVKPEIVLMNVHLKGTQDGIKTGSLVHKRHDLPVIYIMDQGNRATIRRAEGTSPFGYIFKPFDDKLIFTTVETALIRQEFEKELQQSKLEVQQQAERAEILLQVASQVNEGAKLETVLGQICEATTRTLKSAGSAILLKDAKQDVFHGLAAASKEAWLGEYRKARFDIPVKDFQTSTIAENPSIVITPVESFLHTSSVNMFREEQIQTLVMAPLFQAEKLAGLLVSFFPEPLRALREEDRKLIHGLANQAGIAIANTLFFEQVRASRERQQFLARRLVKLQEEERRSLARELHDEVGQMLTGLQFTIKAAMSHSNETQRNKLDQSQIMVSAIISQIRELSINLRPSLLDDLGLLPTLDWYFNRYEAKTGIQVKFQHHNLEQRFHTELETAAFRIVQEALTNVARYAEAEMVHVRIMVEESVLHLEVKDSGRGFDTTTLGQNQSLGIEGMRERAYSIGGLLEIKSEPGQGTRVRADLPISGLLERRTHERNDHPAR